MSKAGKEMVQAKTVTRRAMVTMTAKAAAAMAGGLMATKAAKAEGGHRGGHGGWHGGGHGGWHGGWHGGGHGGGNGKCFLKGTMISTMAGERRVEDLCIGDLVPTAFGGARPIEWIGQFRRTRRDLSKPWVKDARPVRVARSALAPNVPSADLYVTQGHALLIDGLLIPAGSLVNDATITLYAAEEHDEMEFFHVKLESHDVIYAEGAPCETLLRVDETMSNFAGYLRKLGGSETRDAQCAPAVCRGRRSELMTKARSLISPLSGPQQLDLIRARLKARAMTLA